MATEEKRKNKITPILLEATINEYTLRDTQVKVSEWFKTTVFEGKKFFLLNLPVGSGKTLSSMLIIKEYLDNVNSKAKFDILTCNKNLQTQYMDDFKFLNNLWGRSNYQCEKHSSTCEHGKVCNQNNKEVCSACPHTYALTEWMEGIVSITNFHTLGLFSLYTPELIKSRGSDVLIIDEAHSFEETINGFCSFSISKKQWLKHFSQTLIDKWEYIFDYTDISELSSWCRNEFLPEIEKLIIDLNRKVKSVKQKKELDKIIKGVNEIQGLKGIVKNFLEDFNISPNNWAADKKSFNGNISWEIQPIWTSKILQDKIWSNYKHVVLLSGTIDKDIFCELNGIDKSEVAYIKAEMDFPEKNRPIYYAPRGKMSFKEKHNSWKAIKPYLEKLLKKYEGKKGIIHAGNYEIAEWIKADFGDNKRLIFADQTNRQLSIDTHINSKTDTILVSPSMTQGLDLCDDLSRFQIIMKMPYPSLANKVNKLRFEQKPQWYAWQTILELLQSYGRSIRNENDHADTIIFDSCFADLINQYSYMFPDYFKNVIKQI